MIVASGILHCHAALWYTTGAAAGNTVKASAVGGEDEAQAEMTGTGTVATGCSYIMAQMVARLLCLPSMPNPSRQATQAPLDQRPSAPIAGTLQQWKHRMICLLCSKCKKNLFALYNSNTPFVRLPTRSTPNQQGETDQLFPNKSPTLRRQVNRDCRENRLHGEKYIPV